MRALKKKGEGGRVRGVCACNALLLMKLASASIIYRREKMKERIQRERIKEEERVTQFARDKKGDLRWDVCVLSRLHTGAWNVRFLWSKRMAKV